MGRPQKGFQLRRRPGRPWSVRFTIGGKQIELGTGEQDHERAAQVAAQLFADAVRGARRHARRSSARGQTLETIAAQWLDAVAPTIDDRTRATYAGYAATHWARWSTVEAITTASAANYARDRLRSVRASTVRKELSALRGMLAWAHEQGVIADLPALPSIPKRAVGRAHKLGRNSRGQQLTPAEVAAILAQLPERSAARCGSFPIRAYFVAASETGLRQSTLEALSVPEHWRQGADALTIDREDDKARDARIVPLSKVAIAALQSVAPKSGAIFGDRDRRGAWRAACVAVLGPVRGKLAQPYDLRRARLSLWAEVAGDNLIGLATLAGHRSIATTARYVRDSERAARAVLDRMK
jgi:integrase